MSDYDNDGPTNGTVMLQNEIGVTPSPTSNCRSRRRRVDAPLGPNVPDEMPDKRNATLRDIQFAGGDNSAVAAYPAFSPFGINGAYYYGEVVYRF